MYSGFPDRIREAAKAGKREYDLPWDRSTSAMYRKLTALGYMVTKRLTALGGYTVSW